MYSPPTNLVLIGFMGTGKSSVGRLLAQKLRFRFVDTDALIARRAGMSIPEIFAREGEPAFRDRESAALQSLLGRTGRVVATGGGIVTRPANIAPLHRLGFTILLTASEETVFQRVSRNQRRPLLRTENPRQTIADLLARRAPLYAAAAQFTVDTTALDHAEVARVILEETARRFPAKATQPT